MAIGGVFVEAVRKRLDQVFVNGKVVRPSDVVWTEIVEECLADEPELNAKTAYTRVQDPNRKVGGVPLRIILGLDNEGDSANVDPSQASETEDSVSESSDDSDATVTSLTVLEEAGAIVLPKSRPSIQVAIQLSSEEWNEIKPTHCTTRRRLQLTPGEWSSKLLEKLWDATRAQCPFSFTGTSLS
jgi:hypothetical protein